MPFCVKSTELDREKIGGIHVLLLMPFWVKDTELDKERLAGIYLIMGRKLDAADCLCAALQVQSTLLGHKISTLQQHPCV